MGRLRPDTEPVTAVKLRSLFEPTERPAMKSEFASVMRTAAPLALMPKALLKSLPG